jgi:hypothetical protein
MKTTNLTKFVLIALSVRIFLKEKAILNPTWTRNMHVTERAVVNLTLSSLSLSLYKRKTCFTWQFVYKAAMGNDATD